MVAMIIIIIIITIVSEKWKELKPIFHVEMMFGIWIKKVLII